MEKRGISHLEVILAFLLFIGALITAFYFFNPITSFTPTLFTADKITNSIEKEISSSVLTYSVKLSDAERQSNIINVGLGQFGTSSNVKVSAESGGIPLPSNFNTYGAGENTICIQKSSGWIGNELVYIKIGEDLADNAGAVTCSGSGNYVVGSYTNQSIISEKKALALANEYNTNYGQIKYNLEIPTNVDFTFKLEYPGIATIVEPTNVKIPENLEISSTTKRVEILKADGNAFIFGNLTISTW